MTAKPHGAPEIEDHERRFTELYGEQCDFVWRSVRMMGISPDAADDVVQDVFLVAHRRLADFEARSAPRTWLYAIARRVVSGHRRSLRRRFQLLTKLSSADRHSAPATPHDASERSQTNRALIAALEALPEDQRTVFALIEIEDMTAPEAASALGVNVNTVYSRLRIARRNLAAELQGTRGEVLT